MTTNNVQLNDQLDLSDLEWDAFRFVSDEMAADECAEFEQRLVVDPRVAGAVSRVLELSDALTPETGSLASGRKPAVVRQGSIKKPSTARGKSPIAVVASLAACCLVAMLIATGQNKEATPTEIMSSTEEAQPALIVDGWLEAIGSVTSSLEEPVDDAVELAILEPLTDSDGDGEIVPDWMYAAFQETASNEVTFE